MYKVKNTNLTKNSKIKVENAQNNVFMILIFFEKNFANILPKSIIIDVKK